MWVKAEGNLTGHLGFTLGHYLQDTRTTRRCLMASGGRNDTFTPDTRVTDAPTLAPTLAEVGYFSQAGLFRTPRRRGRQFGLKDPQKPCQGNPPYEISRDTGILSAASGKKSL